MTWVTVRDGNGRETVLRVGETVDWVVAAIESNADFDSVTHWREDETEGNEK